MEAFLGLTDEMSWDMNMKHTLFSVCLDISNIARLIAI